MWRASRLDAWMSANSTAASRRAGSSSSAMRANIAWSPRITSAAIAARAPGP
jgi:hypothetical protein